jgi:hypothetical protein
MGGLGVQHAFYRDCSRRMYEFDPIKRQITAARIYFDVATLLKQISSHQPQVLQILLL